MAIFHFGGHANGYQLLLESAAGKPAAADAGGLAAFLAQQRGLQLVFLNGCSTERQVQGLLDAGVSAVIATDQAIDDAVATAFAARFYQGLAGGAAIGAAFGEAEAAMQIQPGSKFRDLGAAAEERQTRPVALAAAVEARRRGGSRSGACPKPRPTRCLACRPALPRLAGEPFRYLHWFDREHAEVFFGRGQRDPGPLPAPRRSPAAAHPPPLRPVGRR